MEVEHVDFISIVSQDVERSRRFYLETLSLPWECDTPVGFEVRAGQVTLSVWDPSKVGVPFAPNPNDVALRVDDVAARRAELESKASSSAATSLTPVSATWLSSTTRTATR